MFDEARAYEKSWALFLLKREKCSFLYGGKRAYIERRKTMMKAIKNFMNKPVTWGDSFKWSGIVLGLYAAVIGACVAYEKWTDYKAEKEMLKKMQESNLEDNI